MKYSDATSNNCGTLSKTEDIIARTTYEELSREFKNLYPTVSRAFQLISLMYNRLTIGDKLSHKEAVSKIYEDHKHLQGFSQRNIRRSLMELSNPNIPHRRSRKIRPSWPNSVDSGGLIDIDVREKTRLPYKNPVAEQNHRLGNDLTSKTECSNCSILLLQTHKLEKDKSKVVEGYEQTLQIIKSQEQKIFELQNAKSRDEQQARSSVKVLDEEIALQYEPLRQAMTTAFKLKENNFRLTLRFSKNTGNIIAVYTGRKSDVVNSSQSILSRGNG
jgi:hypothetical protein